MEGDVGAAALRAAGDRAGEGGKTTGKERQCSDPEEHLELLSENGR